VTEALEARQAVGAALDHLHLVDHPFRVAVAGGLVEVGQELLAPLAKPLGE
jgi:hypothetical protein